MKAGIYIDIPYISSNGGRGMRFDILRTLIEDDETQIIRMNAYATYDKQRAREDHKYKLGADEYFRMIRDFGFKLIKSDVYLYQDEDDDVEYQHSTHEMRLAIDILDDAKSLDRIVIVAGEGDFSDLVKKVQNQGCRVELIGFKNVERSLREVVDSFYSGYLIPGLVPCKCDDKDKPWGTNESYVRGVCYDFKPDRDYGFARFAKELSPDYWITDTRDEFSPFATAFIHKRQLEQAGVDVSLLPSRDLILEFLIKSKEEGWSAEKVRFVYNY